MVGLPLCAGGGGGGGDGGGDGDGAGRMCGVEAVGAGSCSFSFLCSFFHLSLSCLRRCLSSSFSLWRARVEACCDHGLSLSHKGKVMPTISKNYLTLKGQGTVILLCITLLYYIDAVRSSPILR